MPSIGQGVIFITGSTDGLGRVVAKEAACTGATVLLHGRDRDRGERALGEIRQASGSQRHRLYLADFSSLAQVRRLAWEVRPSTNALTWSSTMQGSAGRPGSSRELSADGYEQRFEVNYWPRFC